MNVKDTLLKMRADLIQKREDDYQNTSRDIHHAESLLFSHCGWTPPPDPGKPDPSAPVIRYNKEAHAYIKEVGFWEDEVTSAGFIEWLGKKFDPKIIKENSARGAIVIMEKAGLLKVKVEGRGRIGTTYSIVTKPISVSNP